MNWALSVLEQLPQARNMLSIQQAKLSVHAKLSSPYLWGFIPTSQPQLSHIWSLCYSKLFFRFIPTEMGHSVTLRCFLTPSKSQMLGMVWTWHLAEVLKTHLQQLEAPVQCGARRGRLRRRTRRSQAGRNCHFTSCLLTAAIAVMCYCSQPMDKCAQVRGRSETASERD